MNMSVFTYFAAETASAQGAEEASSGIGEFGLDPVAIALQAGVFVVLYILIRKFALKKIVKTLDDRHQTIAESLDNAKKIERDVEKAEARQAEMLQKARKESDDIIAKAHEEAGAMVKEAETRAQEQSEKIVEDARAQISSEITTAEKELRKQMLELVAEASTLVLGEKIDAKKDEALIKKALSGGKR